MESGGLSTAPFSYLHLITCMNNGKKNMANKDETEKPAEKTMAESVAEAVGIAVSQALPAAVMAAAQIQRAGMPAPKVPVNFSNKCEKCGQHRNACWDPVTKKAEHRLAVVWPRVFDKGFPGVWINGVSYSSAGPGHQIVVPRDAQVEQLVNAWEKQEREYNIGRDRSGRQLGAIGYRNGSTAHNVNTDAMPLPMTD